MMILIIFLFSVIGFMDGAPQPCDELSITNCPQEYCCVRRKKDAGLFCMPATGNNNHFEDCEPTAKPTNSPTVVQIGKNCFCRKTRMPTKEGSSVPDNGGNQNPSKKSGSKSGKKKNSNSSSKKHKKKKRSKKVPKKSKKIPRNKPKKIPKKPKKNSHSKKPKKPKKNSDSKKSKKPKNSDSKKSKKPSKKSKDKPKKPSKKKTSSPGGFGDCVCDKTYGLKELRMISKMASTVNIKMYDSKDVNAVVLCAYDNVAPGDEFVCDVGTSGKSRFGTNTLIIICDANNKELCRGNFHTSCSQDIVGTHSTSEKEYTSGVICDKILCSGWKDGNPNDGNSCDDGLEKCECSSSPTQNPLPQR